MAGKERTEPYGKTEQGDRLFAARRRLGLSQQDFADAANIDRGHYLACEAGKNQMSTEKVRKHIAAGFNVDVSTLNSYLDGELSIEAFFTIIAEGDPGPIATALGRLQLRTNSDEAAQLYRAAAQEVASSEFDKPKDLTVDKAESLIRAAANRLRRNASRRKVKPSDV